MKMQQVHKKLTLPPHWPEDDITLNANTDILNKWEHKSLWPCSLVGEQDMSADDV